MALTRRHAVKTLAGAAALVVGAAAGASAQTTDVKFILDWALQGNHSVFTLALDNGHAAKEGLRVQLDRGFGSGDSIVKVASGAYDVGFADVNSLVKFNADNPDKKVIAVYQMFDNTLAAVVTTKKSGIKAPRELEGKKLGAPEGEGSRLLFPAFAKANSVDLGKVSWINVTAQLRDTMLFQGQVDAVTGFTSTVIFNLKGAGMKLEDIVAMPYADFGLDLYGSAVLTTAAYAEKNPKVIAGLVKALIAGTKDAFRDPKAAMASVTKRDPTINEALELERFTLVKDKALLTPFFKANGLGTVVADRMIRGIKVNAEAFNVPNPPKPEDIYTDKFLPPAAERMVREGT